MFNYNCITINNCIHKKKCDINEYGQCGLNFMFYCKSCKYGLKNIYDKCKNSDCPLYLANITNTSLEEYILEEDILEEDILEEDNLEKYGRHEVHEYLHNGECVLNKYGQCKKGWKYFCSCGYGIKGYYSECDVKKCSRYKGKQKEVNSLEFNF